MHTLTIYAGAMWQGAGRWNTDSELQGKGPQMLDSAGHGGYEMSNKKKHIMAQLESITADGAEINMYWQYSDGDKYCVDIIGGCCVEKKADNLASALKAALLEYAEWERGLDANA